MSWDGCRCGRRHESAASELFVVERLPGDSRDVGGESVLLAEVESALTGVGDDADTWDAWRWADAPEPAWVTDAYRAALRKDLAAAASDPVGRDTLSLLWLLNPERLAATARGAGIDAAGSGGDATGNDDVQRSDVTGRDSGGARWAAEMLLDGVVVAQRLINHVHAIQQQLIAAFCRPGVALPAASLADLAGDHATDTVAADTTADTTQRAAPASTPDTGASAAAGRSSAGSSADAVRAGLLRQAAIKAASAEIGCALRLAPVTARMRCENALELVDHHPVIVAGQHAGDIEPYRARLVSESLAVLPRELRTVVERRVAPAVATHTTAALKRLIGREIIAADPAAAERRVEQAKAGRTVYTSRGEHNTGILTAVISAADAELASATLDAIVDTLSTGRLAGGRSRAQLRADAFTDLVRTLATTGHVAITGPGTDCRWDGGDPHSTPRQGSEVLADCCDNPSLPTARPGAVWCGASVSTGRVGAVASYRRPVALNVYVDAATLAGLNDRPGELAGHGAITADTARALAASADTVRAIIARPAGPNRACGTILDAGRAIYRPPDPTSDYVTARDKTCIFPGCRAPARRCDLDHRRPFDADGDTCPCNLDALCRTHHRLKTFAAWTAQPDPDTGRLTWTSPLGHRYPTEQAHLLRDHSAEREPGPPDSGNPDPADDPPPF